MMGNECVTEVINYINSAVSKLELSELISQSSESLLERIVDSSPTRCIKIFEIIDNYTKNFIINIMQKQFMGLIQQTSLFDNSQLESDRTNQVFNAIAPEVEILIADVIFLSVNNALVKQANTTRVNKN
jgi:hypothetical protein